MKTILRTFKIVLIIIVVVNLIVVHSSAFPTVTALESAPDNINKRIEYFNIISAKDKNNIIVIIFLIMVFLIICEY